MVFEPQGGDFVNERPWAFYFVYDDHRSLFRIFETVVRTKCGRREFAMQEDGYVCLVFKRIDFDVLDFTKSVDEVIAPEEHLDGFVACVRKEGHGFIISW
jgi:hypothetical protein